MPSLLTEHCSACKQLCCAAEWHMLWARTSFHAGFLQCAVMWVHLHSWASAVQGCEPDEEDRAGFAGKPSFHVCIYLAPLATVLLRRNCSFLPSTCPSSQLPYITGLWLDLLIHWRTPTCGLEDGRVACLWLA